MENILTNRIGETMASDLILLKHMTRGDAKEIVQAEHECPFVSCQDAGKDAKQFSIRHCTKCIDRFFNMYEQTEGYRYGEFKKHLIEQGVTNEDEIMRVYKNETECFVTLHLTPRHEDLTKESAFEVLKTECPFVGDCPKPFRYASDCKRCIDTYFEEREDMKLLTDNTKINEMFREVQKLSIVDSGDRTSFETGAVRDMHTGKGRMDLLPLTAIIELSKHCEEGALKYGEHNVDKGIPQHSFCDSAMRHLVKYMRGDMDENHLRAAAWNIMWALEQSVTKPEMNDLLPYQQINKQGGESETNV